MAFRKKAGHICAYQPDIVVVPECEHPDKLKFDAKVPAPNDVFWHGENKNKGLGVFSYSRYRFRLLDAHQPDFKTILPLLISDGGFEFLLFAIWANNPQDRKFQYVGQIWKAIRHYDRLLRNKRTILIGDFNSNSIWDLPRREGNHSTVVKYLEQRGIYSAYHRFHDRKQGEEFHPTLFMYHHRDKPYHIDFCFASTHFIEKLKSVEIGSYEQWAGLSDHMPVIVDFDSGS